MKSWLTQRVYILAVLAALLIVVQCINALSGGLLTSLGILPRTLSGLKGILLAPFIHGDWSHLFSNLPILLILSALLMASSVRDYVYSSLAVIVIGGTGVDICPLSLSRWRQRLDFRPMGTAFSAGARPQEASRPRSGAADPVLLRRYGSGATAGRFSHFYRKSYCWRSRWHNLCVARKKMANEKNKTP